MYDVQVNYHSRVNIFRKSRKPLQFRYIDLNVLYEENVLFEEI